MGKMLIQCGTDGSEFYFIFLEYNFSYGSQPVQVLVPDSFKCCAYHQHIYIIKNQKHIHEEIQLHSGM